MMETAVRKIVNNKRKKLAALARDMKASAEAVNLVYTNGAEPGISRIKKGKGFSYIFNSSRVNDKTTLTRIRSLVIPPAWKNVWICSNANGHLQAVGLDAKNRKQYRYHPLWNALRSHTKFSTLKEFGESLPQIRSRVAKDIAQKELCETKVLALIVSLMEETYIRVGNCCYEKENGSHGLTTLKDRHVIDDGKGIVFSFKGKKGIYHEIPLRNRKLSAIVRACRDIPGKELFQYVDDNGSRKGIDSGMVNNYIREISGSRFTAKDFRTWAGTLFALEKLLQMTDSEGQSSMSNYKELLAYVSGKLGNTPTVCKKYYIHPVLFELYETSKLKNYIPVTAEKVQSDWLSEPEIMLLNILNKQPKNDQIILTSLAAS